MMMNDDDLYVCTSSVRYIYYIKYIGAHNIYTLIYRRWYTPRQPCTASYGFNNNRIKGIIILYYILGH